MTTDELRECLKTLGLSQHGIARRLEWEPRMVRYYCSGQAPIPPVVEFAVKYLTQEELKMARKYRFDIADDVPAEIKERLPEFIEAGPATIRDKIDSIQAQLGDTVDVKEDPDDYLLVVENRKAA